MIRSNLNKKRGNTIIETLFYLAIFLVLSVTVINAMIVMTKSFKETRIKREIIQSTEIVERISREIKKANDISLIQANDLRLATKDEAGADKVVEFILSGTDVQLLENGSLTGNLNSPNISVNSLSFSQINTAKGKAVKFSVSVSSNHDPLSRVYDFYNTTVLRGNY